MKKLFFDEAGNTYNNLLDEQQPYFAYLGFWDKDDDTVEKFLKLKEKYHYPKNQENKGITLAKSKPGQKFLIELWTLFGKNAKFVLHDKKYALACKMFEYIYEPVFADVNTLFYQIGFHRYFAWNIYKCLINNEKSAEELFLNFCKFIKHAEQTSLIDFINQIDKSNSQIINSILKFCQVNKNEIASDIDFENHDNQYLLDLTITSLHGLLSVFAGGTSDPMDVCCDASKQIDYYKDSMQPFVNNTNVIFQDIFNHSQITFNLVSIPRVEDSKKVFQLQIADLLVSSMMYAQLNPEEDFSKQLFTLSKNSFCNQFSVLPIEDENFYDVKEIEVYNNIIKLLSSSKTKVNKINELSKLSYTLKLYQDIREQMFLNFIKTYKPN